MVSTHQDEVLKRAVDVFGAELQAAHDVFVLALGGEHDDAHVGERWVFAYAAAHGEAV